MDQGNFIEFYGSKKAIRKQLKNLTKEANNLEDIGIMYGILDNIKEKGYDFQDLKIPIYLHKLLQFLK